MNQSITINFLKNNVYPGLKKNGLEIGNSLGHDLSVKYGKIITSNNPKFINGLGPCVGIAVFGPKHKFAAHSAPELDKPNYVEDFISKKINELRIKNKTSEENLSAVIYGGVAYDSKNPISEDSCRLVDAIEKGCELEGLKPTVITGQYGDGLETRINSYIWGKLIDKIKSSHNASMDEIQKIMEEFFEYVKLPQNINIKFLEEVPEKVKKIS